MQQHRNDFAVVDDVIVIVLRAEVEQPGLGLPGGKAGRLRGDAPSADRAVNVAGKMVGLSVGVIDYNHHTVWLAVGMRAQPDTELWLTHV